MRPPCYASPPWTRTRAPSLDGPDAKVRRALFHANAYSQWQRGFLEPNLYAFTPHVDRSGSRHRYKVVEAPGMDRGASLLIGDLIHNLRSALDHLTFQIVWLSTGRTPTSDTKLSLWRKGIKVNAALRSDLQEILDDIQPDKRPELLPMLREIDALDRIDKHRHLNVIVAAARIIEATVPFASADLPITPLVRGDIAFTLTYDPPQSEADPDLAVTPGVFFGRTGMPHSVADQTVDMFIWQAMRAVEAVIDAFRPAF